MPLGRWEVTRSTSRARPACFPSLRIQSSGSGDTPASRGAAVPHPTRLPCWIAKPIARHTHWGKRASDVEGVLVGGRHDRVRALNEG